MMQTITISGHQGTLQFSEMLNGHALNQLKLIINKLGLILVVLLCILKYLIGLIEFIRSDPPRVKGVYLTKI